MYMSFVLSVPLRLVRVSPAPGWNELWKCMLILSSSRKKWFFCSLHFLLWKLQLLILSLCHQHHTPHLVDIQRTFSWEFLDHPVVQFSSVQSLSCVRLFVMPWTAARQASLSITNSWSLPKHSSIESVMPSNHLILCRPLLLPPSVFTIVKVFSSESILCIRWPKYWSFSLNISPSNEHSGLISFRMDWLDLLAVQGTLKSLLQHHSSKASILWCSAFLIVQLSHPYMTIGKTIALTRWTCIGNANQTYNEVSSHTS